VGGVEVRVAVRRAVRVASKEDKVKETRAEAEGIWAEGGARMFGSTKRKTPRMPWSKILHMEKKLLMRSGNILLKKLGTSKDKSLKQIQGQNLRRIKSFLPQELLLKVILLMVPVMVLILLRIELLVRTVVCLIM